MIYVTRLNGEIFAINCEHIEFVESTPDTIISMTTGKKVVVKEDVEEIIDRVLDYKKKLFRNSSRCNES